MVEESKKGVDLEHEFFKNAKKDDEEGMNKYGVDANESVDKTPEVKS